MVGTPGPPQTPHVDIPVLSLMVSGRETPAGVSHEGGTEVGFPSSGRRPRRVPRSPGSRAQQRGSRWRSRRGFSAGSDQAAPQAGLLACGTRGSGFPPSLWRSVQELRGIGIGPTRRTESLYTPRAGETRSHGTRAWPGYDFDPCLGAEGTNSRHVADAGTLHAGDFPRSRTRPPDQ